MLNLNSIPRRSYPYEIENHAKGTQEMHQVTSKEELRIFLSYAREDFNKVKNLY